MSNQQGNEMTVTNEVLQKFCASATEARYYLCKPWRFNGSIYATNGHMLICIPDDGREEVDPHGKHPDASKVIGQPAVTPFIKIPGLADPIPCERCGGKGSHGEVACDECNGSGTFTWRRHEYDCAECGGSGKIGVDNSPMICEACDRLGESFDRVTARTAIGDTGFQTRYLRVIASLPGAKIAPNGMGTCIFTFDGGIGALMPMSK